MRKQILWLLPKQWVFQKFYLETICFIPCFATGFVYLEGYFFNFDSSKRILGSFRRFYRLVNTKCILRVALSRPQQFIREASPVLLKWLTGISQPTSLRWRAAHSFAPDLRCALRWALLASMSWLNSEHAFLADLLALIPCGPRRLPVRLRGQSR